MTEAEINQYIIALKGVDVVVSSGNSFYFYNPDSDILPDHKFPWATLVTNDLYDTYSNLDRPGFYRLNIGVSKATFRSLFAASSQQPEVNSDVEGGGASSEYDFSSPNQLMPHPEYGRMYWVCVVTPDDETFKMRVSPLLLEAYDLAVSKYNKRDSHI